MTSGIADWIDESPTSRWNWDALKRKHHPLYFLKESALIYLPLFANREPRFAPGEAWAYCNANFVLLGMAIEKLSGVPYADYMRENIFGPAGMNDTDFLPAYAAAERVAEGYVPILDEDRKLVGWKSNMYDLTIEGGADGGSTATADDLIQFSRLLMCNGLIGSHLVDEMLTPVVETPFSPQTRLSFVVRLRRRDSVRNGRAHYPLGTRRRRGGRKLPSAPLPSFRSERGYNGQCHRVHRPLGMRIGKMIEDVAT